MSVYDKYPQLMDPEFVDGYDFDSCWTRENPTGISDIDLCVAMIRAGGNFSKVGSVLGRTRRAVDRAISADVDIFELAADLEDEFLDTVEENYKTMALSGDPIAIKFFLMTKGKNRGYSTRTETTGANGGPVQTEDVTNDAAAFSRRMAAMAARAAESDD